jgi:hypothetical protein
MAALGEADGAGDQRHAVEAHEVLSRDAFRPASSWDDAQDARRLHVLLLDGLAGLYLGVVGAAHLAVVLAVVPERNWRSRHRVA